MDNADTRQGPSSGDPSPLTSSRGNPTSPSTSSTILHAKTYDTGSIHSPNPKSSTPWSSPPSPPLPSEPGNHFPPLPGPHDRPQIMRGVAGRLDASSLVMAGGVAIFQLSSARVVLCYHTRDGYWFLPKGRRDVNEDSATGACREGFEESGYRNRMLPLPLRHIQPLPHPRVKGSMEHVFNTEPVLTELQPLKHWRQYMLHWHIAETLPPDVEREVEEETKRRAALGQHGYVRPRGFEKDLTLKRRVELDWVDEGDGGGDAAAGNRRLYTPVKHEGTAVDSEEELYESKLVPVEEALKKLRGSGMDWVVRVGWEGILTRWNMEERWEERQNE